MQIQWYPGHMTKAKRAMKEDIKLIDLVIELVDARVPLGSRNPDIDELAKGKGRIVLLNKADLADDGCTERWIAWFKEQGIHALRINARSGMGMKQIHASFNQSTNSYALFEKQPIPYSDGRLLIGMSMPAALSLIFLSLFFFLFILISFLLYIFADVLL